MISHNQRLFLEKHRNYRLTFLNEDELRRELAAWCREDLISWLKWNDPNGIYGDEESIEELGNVMTWEEGVELVVGQVV
jgi:hypothetical protein